MGISGLEHVGNVVHKVAHIAQRLAHVFFQALFVRVHIHVADRPGDTSHSDAHTGAFDEAHYALSHGNSLPYYQICFRILSLIQKTMDTRGAFWQLPSEGVPAIMDDTGSSPPILFQTGKMDWYILET